MNTATIWQRTDNSRQRSYQLGELHSHALFVDNNYDLMFEDINRLLDAFRHLGDSTIVDAWWQYFEGAVAKARENNIGADATNITEIGFDFGRNRWVPFFWKPDHQRLLEYFRCLRDTVGDADCIVAICACFYGARNSSYSMDNFR